MRAFLACLLLAISGWSQAAIKTQEIPYKSSDGTQLIGYYAYDDSLKGVRPGVVVVHEWWGLNDYAKRRARDLAALGYSALAIDMYGEGKNTEHPKDAMAFMQAALKDSAAASARFNAGLALLKQQPQTDPNKLAAIGYCFGGKVVLDAARQGVPLAGVVSFHGALVTSTPASPGSIKAKILVEHGALDSMVTADNVNAFKAEMDKGRCRLSLRHPGRRQTRFQQPGRRPPEPRRTRRAGHWLQPGRRPALLGGHAGILQDAVQLTPKLT